MISEIVEHRKALLKSKLALNKESMTVFCARAGQEIRGEGYSTTTGYDVLNGDTENLQLAKYMADYCGVPLESLWPSAKAAA